MHACSRTAEPAVWRTASWSAVFLRRLRMTAIGGNARILSKGALGVRSAHVLHLPASRWESGRPAPGRAAGLRECRCCRRNRRRAGIALLARHNGSLGHARWRHLRGGGPFGGLRDGQIDGGRSAPDTKAVSLRSRVSSLAAGFSTTRRFDSRRSARTSVCSSLRLLVPRFARRIGR